MRLYLDAAIVIYAVEAISPYDRMVRARLTSPGVERVTSELTRLEARVKPLRHANHALVESFDRYFDVLCAEVVALSRPVLERAAELRARYAFLKTPDAIHLAAALTAGCDAFFTNDRRLERCGGLIAVEVLAR